MDWRTPGLPVHHQLLEFTQTHVHCIGDAIQSSHLLLSSHGLCPACVYPGCLFFPSRDISHIGLRPNLKTSFNLNYPDSFEKTVMLGKMEARAEGFDRRWEGWMASPTQWTWVWVNSRSWWWTGRPGVLQSMGSQRVRHDWATELNWSP